MALFGKKKEESSQDVPPDNEMYPGQAPPDDYGGSYGQDYGQYPEGYGQEQYPQGEDTGMQQEGPQAPPPPEESDERIEEITEAIVEEKWRAKEREIEKINEWKDEVTTKLVQLQQQVEDLRSSFDSLHKGMLGKIGEYDENLTNVGTEIKAMEKVFSKVLPSLTDSVNKLQRMSGSGSVKKK